ncbi:MAG TPA: hypothetical protein VLA54_13675 [Acidimicrobiia bacterium]|nr:hypothetical protein [Acidimicrobiia bacterium]
MGQQPNVEITRADLPREVLEPGPPHRWRPTRPGVITAPEQMRWGGAFGTPGPDTGFALRIIRESDLPDRSEGLEAVLAALMGARASLFGRAPTAEDLAVALVVAGYGEGLPPELARRRERWVDATAREASPGRTAAAEVDRDLLMSKPDQVMRRLRTPGE